MRRWLVAAALLCSESAFAADYRKCIALDQAEGEAMAALSRDLDRLAASREEERERQRCGVKPTAPDRLGGWYECIDNWDDYTEVAIHEGEPTHWMPLPAPPQAPNV